MIDIIESLNKVLVNEKIIRFVVDNTQQFHFDLEDGVKLIIGGDKHVKTIAIRSHKGTHLENINMVIEKVDYRREYGVSTLTLNDDLEISFVTETGSYIFISFGNTIEYKLLT